jgi:hypothetical protein
MSNSKHTTRPCAIQLKLDRTPRVGHSELQKCLTLASQVDPQEPDSLATAIEALYGTGDKATALWARVRAYLRWGQEPGKREFDERMVEQWRMEARFGALVDPAWEAELEAKARLLAAAKHPLDESGSFAEGFRASVDAARKKLAAVTPVLN